MPYAGGRHTTYAYERTLAAHIIASTMKYEEGAGRSVIRTRQREVDMIGTLVLLPGDVVYLVSTRLTAPYSRYYAIVQRDGQWSTSCTQTEPAAKLVEAVKSFQAATQVVAA